MRLSFQTGDACGKRSGSVIKVDQAEAGMEGSAGVRTGLAITLARRRTSAIKSLGAWSRLRA
jgi:hypothetical protein